MQPQRLAPAARNRFCRRVTAWIRPNIVYSSHNRPVETSVSNSYLGMSVNSFLSVSGTVYNIEESALQQTGTSFVSQVSSTTNMVVGVLFDYDNDDLAPSAFVIRMRTRPRAWCFNRGYLSAAGYSFSSPDRFDVNGVLPIAGSAP